MLMSTHKIIYASSLGFRYEVRAIKEVKSTIPMDIAFCKATIYK